jgi:hypothetical protein
MEGLTRLVTESLARHGFDRPLDYRRLKWSRWFRCESPHSLLFVPSQPGVFALAEEVMHLHSGNSHAGTATSCYPDEGSSAISDLGRRESNSQSTVPVAETQGIVDGECRAQALHVAEDESRKLQVDSPRMLAVSQFFEADDMAFVLDRMFSYQNPMRARLTSGRFFVRFVVIEDELQRRSITSALNQWIVSSTEKVTGIGSHFASSLELTPTTEYVARTPSSASLSATSPTAPQPGSGAASNINCPSPFPAGF